MELTKKQIQELYEFTRKNSVAYYDVQTELVDHLANDIEQIWEEEPNLSFKEARDKSFKKFGVHGFSDVVSEKVGQMNKKYWKIIFRFVKEWFKLPKIILTTTVLFIFYTAFKTPSYTKIASIVVVSLAFLFLMKKFYFWIYNKKSKILLAEIISKLDEQKPMLFALIVFYNVYNLSVLSFSISLVVLFVINNLSSWLHLKKDNKVFLLEEMINETSFIAKIAVVFMFFNIPNRYLHDFSFLENKWIFLIAFITTVLCTYFYVLMIVIPKKADELLKETYPEYKMVDSF